MLTKPIAIINPGNLKTLIENKTIQEFYGVALDLNAMDSEIDNDIRELLFKSDIKFCFTVNFSSRSSKPSIEAIKELYNKAMLYFFSENYIRINNNPLINFLAHFDNQVHIHDHMMFVSHDEIFAQGFKGIEYAFFNGEIANNFYDTQQPYYYWNLNLSFTTDYEEALLSNYLNNFLTNKFIFINTIGVQDIKQQFSVFKNIEESLKNKNQHLYNVLLTVQNQANLINEQEVHIQSLQQRLDNSEVFLALLRTDLISNSTSLKDQYESYIRERKNLIDDRQAIVDDRQTIVNDRQAILDWYMREYEILPLWYKRFGHIIKIAKGKRSIKSVLKKNKKNH
jgi:hypothetical protein